MSDAVQLVPRALQVADDIRGDAARLLEYVQARDCIAIATVIVHADGSTAVQKRGPGCRVALLGAVTDLQFSIAADGDR